MVVNDSMDRWSRAALISVDFMIILAYFVIINVIGIKYSGSSSIGELPGEPVCPLGAGVPLHRGDRDEQPHLSLHSGLPT